MSKSCLPNPQGPLSKQLPSSFIESANNCIDSLIINWDQTGVNYVPVSEWTMSKEGLKRVEVVGLKDKRQITAVFGGNMSGDFLPV